MPCRYASIIRLCLFVCLCVRARVCADWVLLLREVLSASRPISHVSMKKAPSLLQNRDIHLSLSAAELTPCVPTALTWLSL